MFSLNIHQLNRWKIKKGKALLNAFIEIVNESYHKQNKLWVDQGKEFYNKLMHECKNDILGYSENNEGKSTIVERFMKTSKSKIYKIVTTNYSNFYLPYLNKL